MPVLTTSLYAGLLAIIYMALAANVGMTRTRRKISLGDSGDPDLIVSIRRHANFAEWVPLALLLMALIELNGGSKTWLHTLGAVLLAARIVHPFGLDVSDLSKWQRIAGAAGTILVIAAAALTLLWQSLG